MQLLGEFREISMCQTEDMTWKTRKIVKSARVLPGGLGVGEIRGLGGGGGGGLGMVQVHILYGKDWYHFYVKCRLCTRAVDLDVDLDAWLNRTKSYLQNMFISIWVIEL